MMNQIQQKAIIFLVGIISIAVSLAKNGSVEGVVLLNFGMISTILSLCLILFDIFLWRIRFFFPWFVFMPDLNGRWNATGRITFQGLEDIQVCTGEVIIEQQHSGIHMRFCWDDGAESEFFEAAPMAVSGQRIKRYALSTIYRYRDPNKQQFTRSSFMTFEIPGKLFANRPDNITLIYSTTDGQHGEVDLSPLVK